MHLINNYGIKFTHEFNPNSSGPFGDDFPGNWLNKNDVFSTFFDITSTWRDVHARNTRSFYYTLSKDDNIPNPLAYITKAFEYWDRYEDVNIDSEYGRFGKMLHKGAFEHYTKYGQAELRLY